MKTLTTLITILFISLLSSPSWSETMGDLVIREGVYYQKFTDVPFTGEITGTHQGSIKNGKWVGAMVTYHDNGQLFYKQNYKNGMLEGAFIGYYENGSLFEKGNYKNGKKEGPWVFYNRDGTIYESLTGTFKNGELISD